MLELHKGVSLHPIQVFLLILYPRASRNARAKGKNPQRTTISKQWNGCRKGIRYGENGVSYNSEGTAYHEAFHTVRDWCLTEKENADLEKYYGKKAKEQGIDVEEAIADGYRDWKLARAKGNGTLFGKLYKKIMDFIDTAKAIFKGMYDVHKIYEKIESGDIWNRDSQGRFTKISNTEIDNLKPASVIMEEAKELYNTAAKKFSSITDKAVSESVKEAIQQTLDFGEGFGEILERASGKAIQQSLFSEENAEQANDVRGNTGRIPHQRNSKEIGFSLTRDLINNGFGYTIRRKWSIV